MRKLFYVATTIWVAAILMIGCAAQKVTPDTMTPKEIAIWANRIYEQQYKAYLQDYEYGKDHTEMQRILKKKREVLVQVHPVLIAYNKVLLEGLTPGPTMTNGLVRLIYELTGIY